MEGLIHPYASSMRALSLIPDPGFRVPHRVNATGKPSEDGTRNVPAGFCAEVGFRVPTSGGSTGCFQVSGFRTRVPCIPSRERWGRTI